MRLSLVDSYWCRRPVERCGTDGYWAIKSDTPSWRLAGTGRQDTRQERYIHITDSCCCLLYHWLPALTLAANLGCWPSLVWLPAVRLPAPALHLLASEYFQHNINWLPDVVACYLCILVTHLPSPACKRQACLPFSIYNFLAACYLLFIRSLLTGCPFLKIIDRLPAVFFLHWLPPALFCISVADYLLSPELHRLHTYFLLHITDCPPAISCISMSDHQFPAYLLANHLLSPAYR